MSADCRRPRSQGFSLKKKNGSGAREALGTRLGRSMGLMYGGSLGQNTSQNPKTLSSIQNTSIQESKIQFPESKKVLDSGTCFVPMNYVTHASGAPLPEPNHHFLNNNNIEKNKSFIVVTSKLYLHNYWVTTKKQHYM